MANLTLKGRGGYQSGQGIGAQFEAHPSRHASIDARDLSDDAHKGSQQGGNKATPVDHGFQSIDRAKVGTHNGRPHGESRDLPPIRRWRHEEHAAPWNNIGEVKKLGKRDGKKASGARRSHKTNLSTATAKGSLDTGLQR